MHRVRDGDWPRRMGPASAAMDRDDRVFPWAGALVVLLVAALALSAGALLRSTEYDENYSVFVTSGIPRPDWPTTAFAPAEVAAPFTGRADAAEIAGILRETDVHPPLYFWLLGLWRGLAGDELLALRGLSILFSVGAVAVWMAAAWRAGIPPLTTGLSTALAFGFAYTGHVARGFALSHLLLALGAWAAVEAWRCRYRAPAAPALWAAAGAGLAGGLASFSNYLAVFPAAAVLAWLVALAPGFGWRRRIGVALAAGLPFALVQLGNLYFFIAQRGSRTEQFEPFAVAPALYLLAQFNAANLFGGLPLYADGIARLALAVLLVALLGAVALAVLLRWRGMGPTRWLWVLGFAAPSAGLLLLGAAFGNTPIELRYLGFAAPFAGALIAAAAAAWGGTWPSLARVALGLVLLAQAAGAVGMALHPATRQTYRDALAAVAPELGPRTVLLVPYGNDGVGITGSTLQEAAPDQPVLVLRLRDAAQAAARARAFPRAVLLAVTDRDGEVQVERALESLRADPGWREEGTPWRDMRRGFFATVFVQVPPPERGGGTGGALMP